jgi:hypothetical protein
MRYEQIVYMCDECGKHAPLPQPNRSDRYAWEVAAAGGWHRAGRNHYCPDCRPAGIAL